MKRTLRQNVHMTTFVATPKRLPRTIVPQQKTARMLMIEREAAASFADWYPELTTGAMIQRLADATTREGLSFFKGKRR